MDSCFFSLFLISKSIPRNLTFNFNGVVSSSGSRTLNYVLTSVAPPKPGTTDGTIPSDYYRKGTVSFSGLTAQDKQLSLSEAIKKYEEQEWKAIALIPYLNIQEEEFENESNTKPELQQNIKTC